MQHSIKTVPEIECQYFAGTHAGKSPQELAEMSMYDALERTVERRHGEMLLEMQQYREETTKAINRQRIASVVMGSLAIIAAIVAGVLSGLLGSGFLKIGF